MAEADERTEEVFQQFVDKILPEIRKRSSFLANTIRSEVNKEGFAITISSLYHVLYKGRGPTRNSGSGSGGTLQQAILSWIQSKGIIADPAPNGNIPSAESLSWVISKSIHLYGNKLYQQGGKDNPFKEVFTDDRIDALLTLLGNHYFADLDESVISKGLKNLL